MRGACHKEAERFERSRGLSPQRVFQTRAIGQSRRRLHPFIVCRGVVPVFPEYGRHPGPPRCPHRSQYEETLRMRLRIFRVAWLWACVMLVNTWGTLQASAWGEWSEAWGTGGCGLNPERAQPNSRTRRWMQLTALALGLLLLTAGWALHSHPATAAGTTPVCPT